MKINTIDDKVIEINYYMPYGFDSEYLAADKEAVYIKDTLEADKYRVLYYKNKKNGKSKKGIRLW